jgi:hypothetical protein
MRLEGRRLEGLGQFGERILIGKGGSKEVPEETGVIVLKVV